MISITKQRERLEARMKKLAEDISALQTACPHTGAFRKAKADTGNWDRGHDSYWYEFKCLECGKFWTELQ
jgi:hypothetical protein